MLYEVVISPDIDRELRRVPANDVARIRAAIDGLAADPRPPQSKALQGNLKGKYRIRVGDYRVVYTIQDSVVTVHVLRVAQRGDIYG